MTLNGMANNHAIQTKKSKPIKINSRENEFTVFH